MGTRGNFNLFEDFKVPVIGNQVIGVGGNGDVHKLIIVGVGFNQLPFVVGFLQVGVGSRNQHFVYLLRGAGRVAAGNLLLILQSGFRC